MGQLPLFSDLPEIDASAVSDNEQKRKAVELVSGYLVEVFENDPTTWEKLDTQALDAIAGSASGLMLMGEYEKAALGLVYLIYQKRFEETNKLEARLKELTI